MTDISQSPLGHSCRYLSQYDPALLCPLPRQPGRALLMDPEAGLPFVGVDIWNAMELSWLDAQGKPVVMVGCFELPAHSPQLIESKSLKLYLNSFNQSRFSSCEAVRQCLAQDLSLAAGAAVQVTLKSLERVRQEGVQQAPGLCIDAIDIPIDVYEPPSPDFLAVEAGRVVSETLHSHLLKSNCPVTGQPDWGTLVVDYTGPRLDRAGLLRYLCSFRQHQDFHEHCIERIFVDVRRRCATQRLSISGHYLRRGGLDINPWRTDGGLDARNARLARQ
ncbi:MAG: NADPH-dependent 7-cyano-7-deazaguanine reductase QueF [Kistimonas sp.]|nr:NADPH-dependent 7-cyano-7-deazaguanine reductase QueF [Kistimonas sp.]